MNKYNILFIQFWDMEAAYLSQLMPIQTMPRIEFENKRIIYFCSSPNLTVNAEQEEEEQCEEVAGIKL